MIIPLVVFIVGNKFSQAVKEKEIRGKYVELAVSILQTPPTQQNAYIRAWATEVVNSYSGVPLSERTKEDLIRTGALETIDLGGQASMQPVERAPASGRPSSGVPAPTSTRPTRDSVVAPSLRLNRAVVSVPNLTGLSLAQATQLTTRAGLRIGQVRTVRTGAGVVVSQTPAAGTAVILGSSVSLMMGGN